MSATQLDRRRPHWTVPAGLAVGVGVIGWAIRSVDARIVEGAGGDAALGLTPLTSPLGLNVGWSARVGRWQEFALAVRADEVPLGAIVGYVALDLLLFIPLYGTLLAWGVRWGLRAGVPAALVRICTWGLIVGVAADVLETAGIGVAVAWWLRTTGSVEGAGALLLGLSQVKWLGLGCCVVGLAACVLKRLLGRRTG